MTVGWHLLFLSIINITYNINIHQTYNFLACLLWPTYFSQRKGILSTIISMTLLNFLPFFPPLYNIKPTKNSRDSVLREAVEENGGCPGPCSREEVTGAVLYLLHRARIFKRLWSPGIDSKK
jgi:hypothetical protein